MKKSYFSSIALWCFIVCISACGWHLRGITPLPKILEELYLISNTPSYFKQALMRDLRINGVTFMTELTPSINVLEIKSLQIQRRELTVNASGQIDEYQLDAFLNAELIIQSKHKSQTFQIKAQRFFNNDLSNQAGTRADEELQRKKLKQELINRLISQLSNIDMDNNHDITP